MNTDVYAQDFPAYLDGPEAGIDPGTARVVFSRIQHCGPHNWRKITIQFKNPTTPLGVVFAHVGALDGIGGGVASKIPAESPEVRMAMHRIDRSIGRDRREAP